MGLSGFERRKVMALPIRPTPVLRGKEADLFLAKLRENNHKAASLPPTPKLAKAYKLIRKYAEGEQKLVR